jgi:error-prone DNA polymerase
MVIAAGRLDEVVPIEPASMPGRSVIQWDKEDCSELGIIKVDLLGLGMLNALERAIPLVRATEGIELDYAKLPPRDPQVYDLISRADTIGVFQIESRAQMSTLPRLKPQCFYDLVIEIALIRPGPIVGQMVHPYMRRRDGIEPVTYAHPSLEPILARTLGVPIFQEQILRMAMAVAGFTGGEAEELRRAMGFKRSEERMQSIQARLREGMVQNAIPPETRENIITQITSFALYGFPESHSASFALIAYASAYLKTHHPGAFLCSLLNAWPMGFYSPATLIKDAQRRGVSVQAIDVTKSDYACTLPDARTVRMGLRYVSGLREQSAASIVQARQRAPFESLSDLRQRVSMSQEEWMRLAELGAFQKLGPTRRQAIWQLSRHPTPALFASLPSKHHTSPLQEMSFEQRIASDYKNSSFSVGPHPIHLIRSALDRAHVASSHSLNQRPHGSKVRVAGVVIIRQRPMTAKGLLFITLEDEFGLINLIISPNLFEKQRTLAVNTAALLAEGTVQSHRGVIHLKCEQIFDLYRHIPRPTQAHTHPEKTHLLQRKIQ